MKHCSLTPGSKGSWSSSCGSRQCDVLGSSRGDLRQIRVLPLFGGEAVDATVASRNLKWGLRQSSGELNRICLKPLFEAVEIWRYVKLMWKFSASRQLQNRSHLISVCLQEWQLAMWLWQTSVAIPLIYESMTVLCICSAIYILIYLDSGSFLRSMMIQRSTVISYDTSIGRLREFVMIAALPWDENHWGAPVLWGCWCDWHHVGHWR